MRRLIVSLAAGPRLDEARRWLTETAQGREVTVVGASQRAADDFARESAQGASVFGVHRTTLNRLAADLSALRLAAAGRTRLSALGAEALAARAVHLARREAPLAYFDPVASTPGFPRAVADTLAELRMEEVAPHALAATGAAGADLVRLLHVYDRELEATGLADRARIFQTATAAIADGRHLLLGRPTLLLDLSPRTGAEARLLEALIHAAPDVLAIHLVRDTEAIQRLERALGTQAVVLDDLAPPHSALARARRFVFSADDPSPPEGTSPLDDQTVELFSAPGEAREAVEIARRILELAANGTRFDRVAVLLRNPETYQPLLEDALRRANIPGFFTRSARRPDPSGRALLALLACASERLSAARFGEYLSLGQVPAVDEAGAPPVRVVPWVAPKNDVQLVFASLVAEPASPAEEDDDAPVMQGNLRVPIRWEQLIVDASVIGGRDRWKRRLLGLERELTRRIRALKGGDPAQQKKLERDLASLKHLQRFALPLVGILADLPSSAPWGDWIERLEALAARSLRAPEAALAVLAELRPMADVGPVGLEEVRQVLAERLAFLRDEPEGARYGKVFVGTLDEAAGREADVVFLPGLVEGIFPRKVFEDPLLLDLARMQIDPALSRRPRHLVDERLRLHLALGTARAKVFASFPRVDVITGRSRVPSFYAMDLVRAASGTLPDLAHLEAQAARGRDVRLGWPAPRTPERAIDDAEYDLAVLGPLVFEAPEAVEGRGRYLISDSGGTERNGPLVRALRAQAAKWRSAWRQHDGLIVEDGAPRLLALAQTRPSARVYSPTALQAYAACPYRFYLQGILRLRPREAPVAIQELDPLTRGSLFHEVQKDTFGALGGAGLLPLSPENVEQALPLVNAALAAAASRWAEQLAPALPDVWNREMESLGFDLRRWLRDVAQYSREWRPIHAELAFGLPGDEGRDPNSVDTPMLLFDKYRVRGSVDLVEAHVMLDQLRVTDHKTGKVPKDAPRTIGGGEHLQPIIYAMAVEAMLGREVVTGRLYYCTTRGGFTTVDVGATERTKDKLRYLLESIDDAATHGFFPAAPRPGGCTYCDYRTVCGRQEERRVLRKAKAPLERLFEIRRSR